MHEIIISEKTFKQLSKLEKQIQIHILSSLERIRFRPESYVKKLVGIPGYRLRAGDHRIIMDIDKNKLIILVLKIGHRKNTYKN
jgi:mRNA interferase RelE/StbE